MVSAVGRVLFAAGGFLLLLLYFMAPGDGIPVPPPFQKPTPSLMSFAKRPRHVRVGGLVDLNEIQGPRIPAEPRQPAESPSVVLDVPEREEFFVTWIRRRPGHGPARTEYAEFLALQGRLDEALIQVTEAGRLMPGESETKAVLALVTGLRQAEDVKTGNGILSAWYARKLQQAFPGMDSLPRAPAQKATPATDSWEIAQARLRTRFNVSREDFEHQYLPTAEEAMAWLAVQRYFDVKLTDDAEYAARRYRDRFSGSPFAIARSALGLFDVGKHEEAETWLVGAVTRFPKQLAPLVALEIVRQYQSQKWDLSIWRANQEFDIETRLIGFNELQRVWSY